MHHVCFPSPMHVGQAPTHMHAMRGKFYSMEFGTDTLNYHDHCCPFGFCWCTLKQCEIVLTSSCLAMSTYLVMGFPHPKHSIPFALHCFSVRLVGHFNEMVGTQGALEKVLHKSPTITKMSLQLALSQRERGQVKCKFKCEHRFLAFL